MFRVVITVLDNFHFDLSLVSSECLHGDGGRHGNDTGAAGDAATTIADRGKSGDGETKRGATVDEEGGEEEAAEEVEVDETEGRSRAVAMKIYRTIVKTILPNLQEVLTKKVILLWGAQFS